MGLHLQLACVHGSGEEGNNPQFHVVAERDAESLCAFRRIK